MDENQLDTFIYSNLKDMGKARFASFYKGTYASDELHKLHIRNFKKPACFTFIVNTLKRKSPKNAMGHWLCLAVKLKPETRTLNIKFWTALKTPIKHMGRAQNI